MYKMISVRFLVAVLAVAATSTFGAPINVVRNDNAVQVNARQPEASSAPVPIPVANTPRAVQAEVVERSASELHTGNMGRRYPRRSLHERYASPDSEDVVKREPEPAPKVTKRKNKQNKKRRSKNVKRGKKGKDGTCSCSLNSGSDGGLQMGGGKHMGGGKEQGGGPQSSQPPLFTCSSGQGGGNPPGGDSGSTDSGSPTSSDSGSPTSSADSTSPTSTDSGSPTSSDSGSPTSSADSTSPTSTDSGSPTSSDSGSPTPTTSASDSTDSSTSSSSSDASSPTSSAEGSRRRAVPRSYTPIGKRRL